MPHCIVEHSFDIEGHALLSGVFAGALASGLFASDGSDIKARSIAFEHCTTGGQPARFVHVTVKVLSGRTSEQKQQLAQRVLDALATQGLKQVSLTVDIVDMDRASYAKLLT